MSKAVMISIRPEWCEKIFSGEKTVEIRKTRPKLETPFKVYIYATKAGLREYLKSLPEVWHDWHGKVIGEFICDKIINVDCDSVSPFDANTKEYIENESCIDRETFISYTKGFSAYGWHISNLKIYDKSKELTDFYRPGAESLEDLVDDERLCSYCAAFDFGLHSHGTSPITGAWFCEGSKCDEAYQEYLGQNLMLNRPPQSWCYVEEMEGVKE